MTATDTQTFEITSGNPRYSAGTFDVVAARCRTLLAAAGQAADRIAVYRPANSPEVFCVSLPREWESCMYEGGDVAKLVSEMGGYLRGPLAPSVT
jgi:hypothetical protein